MIGTGTTVLATAGVVALGIWANDKTISMKYVVGTGMYAAGLSIVGEANPDFAAKVGLLVFVTAILVYGPAVAAKLGLISSDKGILGNLGEAIARGLGSAGVGGAKVGGVAGSAVR